MSPLFPFSDRARDLDARLAAFMADYDRLLGIDEEIAS